METNRCPKCGGELIPLNPLNDEETDYICVSCKYIVNRKVKTKVIGCIRGFGCC